MRKPPLSHGIAAALGEADVWRTPEYLLACTGAGKARLLLALLPMVAWRGLVEVCKDHGPDRGRFRLTIKGMQWWKPIEAEYYRRGTFSG